MFKYRFDCNAQMEGSYNLEMVEFTFIDFLLEKQARGILRANLRYVNNSCVKN